MFVVDILVSLLTSTVTGVNVGSGIFVQQNVSNFCRLVPTKQKMVQR